MTSADAPRLIFLLILLVAIGGSYLMSQRGNMGKTAQQAAIWGLIFLGAVGAVGLWEDIRNDVAPRTTFVGETIEIPRGRDGHYTVTLGVNDVPVRFVVDTGASQIVLTQEDAQRAGLRPETLAFIGQASTANGIVRTAPVTLDSITAGEIVDTNVRAVVNEGDLFDSLLGMTYLNQFSTVTIENDRMILRR